MLRPIMELCIAKIGVTERGGRRAGVRVCPARERRNGRSRCTTRRSAGLRKLGREGGSRRDRIAVCAGRRRSAQTYNTGARQGGKVLVRQGVSHSSGKVCCDRTRGVALKGDCGPWARG